VSPFRSGLLFGLGLGFLLITIGVYQETVRSTAAQQQAQEGASSSFLVSPVQTKATGAFTGH
jgi:hypothetical protein